MEIFITNLEVLYSEQCIKVKINHINILYDKLCNICIFSVLFFVLTYSVSPIYVLRTYILLFFKIHYYFLDSCQINKNVKLAKK